MVTKTGDYKNCLICSKEYYVKKSHSYKSKYCSWGCAHKSKEGVTRKKDNCVCISCKAPFHRKPSHIKKGGGSYCSRSCQSIDQEKKFIGSNNPNYRHGRTYEKGFYKETSARWRSNNKDVISVHARRQKAIRRSVDGKFSIKEIRNLKETQRSKCINCFSSIKDKYHVDHIIPIKLGGTNNIENIQLLCPTCNLSKGAKDPIYWANENGRLL